MMNGISIIMINSNSINSRCCRLISSNYRNKIISKCSTSSNNHKRLLCQMTTSYSNQVEQQQQQHQQQYDLIIKPNNTFQQRRRQQQQQLRRKQQFFHVVSPTIQNLNDRSNIRMVCYDSDVLMKRRSYSTSTSPLSMTPSTTTTSSATATTTIEPIAAGTVTSLTDNNQLPSSLEHTKLIDFYISSKIEGEESNVVMIDIEPGEILRAEAGSMIFMTEGIVMDTKMNGISSAFNRVLTGQNVFLTDFYYDPTSDARSNNKGTVCLGTDFPSKILRFDINELPNQTLICQRGAYLASNSTINIETEFTKTLTSGFFGGQGFILQKLNGIGEVLIKGGGTIKTLTLHNNETLRVTSGSIVAFESSVSYDVQMMSGMTNIMFSGEGLFITTLKGPGRVWLQGMTPDRMIAEIARRIPSSSGIGFGIPLGIGGGGGGGTDGGNDGTIMPTPDGISDDNSTNNTDVLLTSDEAINADRNATVASSGISSSNDDDANSPTALFGDAAPKTTSNSSTTDYDNDATMNSNVSNNDDDTSFSSSSSNETSFGDDPEFYSNDNFTATNDNTTADDDFSNNINNNEMKADGELFYDDNSNNDNAGTSDTIDEVDSSSGNSIFSTLWDFFTGRDE